MSFNSVSVEGHTSTNDSLIFLASGQGQPLAGADLDRFNQAAGSVCAELARQYLQNAPRRFAPIPIPIQV